MAEYIERKKLLESLKDSEKKLYELYDTARTQDVAKSCYGQLIILTECILRIKEQPTAEVEPVRHGRWEQCFEDWRKQIEGDKCSACGFEHYGCNIRSYSYCPNCGARMDGGGNHG